MEYSLLNWQLSPLCVAPEQSAETRTAAAGLCDNQVADESGQRVDSRSWGKLKVPHALADAISARLRGRDRVCGTALHCRVRFLP